MLCKRLFHSAGVLFCKLFFSDLFLGFLGGAFFFYGCAGTLFFVVVPERLGTLDVLTLTEEHDQVVTLRHALFNFACLVIKLGELISPGLDILFLFKLLKSGDKILNRLPFKLVDIVSEDKSVEIVPVDLLILAQILLRLSRALESERKIDELHDGVAVCNSVIKLEIALACLKKHPFLQKECCDPS